MKNSAIVRFGKFLVIAGIGFTCWATQAATYPGNGGTGFGGPLGTGSLTLTDDGTTVIGTFTRGTGDHTDFLVMYIDSISGGLTTTIGINDTADENRQSISGGFGGSFVNFASGFETDYAISLYNDLSTSGGLWTTIDGNNMPFVDAVNLSGGGKSAPSYTFSFDLAGIGLTPNAGDAFKFVVTYTASSGFRSDEAIGSGVEPGNPGSNPITFTGFETYTSVPEPSACLLLVLGLSALGLIIRVRRRA